LSAMVRCGKGSNGTGAASNVVPVVLFYWTIAIEVNRLQ
jgi:hypothetical protein